MPSGISATPSQSALSTTTSVRPKQNLMTRLCKLAPVGLACLSPSVVAARDARAPLGGATLADLLGDAGMLRNNRYFDDAPLSAMERQMLSDPEYRSRYESVKTREIEQRMSHLGAVETRHSDALLRAPFDGNTTRAFEQTLVDAAYVKVAENLKEGQCPGGMEVTTRRADRRTFIQAFRRETRANPFCMEDTGAELRSKVTNFRIMAGQMQYSDRRRGAMLVDISRFTNCERLVAPQDPALFETPTIEALLDDYSDAIKQYLNCKQNTKTGSKITEDLVKMIAYLTLFLYMWRNRGAGGGMPFQPWKATSSTGWTHYPDTQALKHITEMPKKQFDKFREDVAPVVALIQKYFDKISENGDEAAYEKFVDEVNYALMVLPVRWAKLTGSADQKRPVVDGEGNKVYWKMDGLELLKFVNERGQSTMMNRNLQHNEFIDLAMDKRSLDDVEYLPEQSAVAFLQEEMPERNLDDAMAFIIHELSSALEEGETLGVDLMTLSKGIEALKALTNMKDEKVD